MQKTLLEFEKIHSFPQLTLDYLSCREELEPFYKYTPIIESFNQAMIDRAQFPVNRRVLVEVLLEQHKNVSEEVLNNIKSLHDENTFTLTTGHQLNIFTGPLYFLYKIITILNLAKELKKAYPENNFVPVYWMASEDHDIDEINHFNIFGKTLTWETNQKGAAGKLDTKSMVILLDQLDELLGESPNANYLRNLFNKAYEENENLSAATRYLVNDLFGKHGLVIMDASHPSLKVEFVENMKEDLLNSKNFNAVTKTMKSLDKDYKIQVNPREINLFYMKDNLRERIVKLDENNFEILNSEIRFSKDEIISELNDHPEHFSPNVVLRPVYQQRILPNLAYIGGPAEIAYWLEYKEMFDSNNVFYPILMLRNSVLWIDDNYVSKMEKLNLDIPPIFRDTESLVKEYVIQNSDNVIDFEKMKSMLSESYKSIAAEAIKIDKTLVPAIDAELQKQMNSLEGIEGKIIRAQKKKMETSVNQIRNIKIKLFPNNSLQERQDNFIPYYLKYGPEFIETLIENLNPFEKQFVIFSERKSG
jgi:bacillithiol biosynthesis cysteine-adding enzyme BshC